MRFTEPFGTPRLALFGGPGLTLLSLLFLLVGLTGHDPWRGDDSLYFGPVYAMLGGEGWLLPQVAGQAFVDFPPLYYWVAALCARLTAFLLPIHDGARLASAVFAGLTIVALWHAARDLYGEDHAAPAGLLAIGSLGLVVHAHESQPLLALMATLALTLAGLAHIPRQARRGGLLAGLGIAGGLLAGGLPGLLLTLAPTLALALTRPASGGESRRRGLLHALPLAALLASLWPLQLQEQAPAAFAQWWQINLELLSPGPALPEPGRLLQVLSWFTWPLWPLTLWSLWRARGQLREAGWLLPLSAALMALLLVILGGSLRPARLLPLLPPLALLAVGGLFTLRRGAANAFDWFATMTFGVFALLVWLAWSAMVWSWPPGLARQAAKLAPGFRLDDILVPLTMGVAICALWVAVLIQLPRAPRRGAFNWALGMTMLWCLAVTLLLPWFQHGKTYRPAAQSLSQALSNFPPGCVAASGINTGQQAAFDYFANIRFSAESASAEACKMVLVYGDAVPAGLAPDTWEEVWQFRRGGGRQLEVFRLYRRD